MKLYRFADGAIVSAQGQLKAIEIYEGETGKLHFIPNQMYGNLAFCFEGDMLVSLPATAEIGTRSAIDYVGNWAAHWPNRKLDFLECWGVS